METKLKKTKNSRTGCRQISTQLFFPCSLFVLRILFIYTSEFMSQSVKSIKKVDHRVYLLSWCWRCLGVQQTEESPTSCRGPSPCLYTLRGGEASLLALLHDVSSHKSRQFDETEPVRRVNEPSSRSMLLLSVHCK